MTPNGIPRRAIVKSEDAQAFRDYDRDSNRLSGTQSPLKFFRKYFIFKEQPRQAYLVGSATVRDSVCGWVRESDVLAWNHDQAVYFINKAARQAVPVRLWRKREHVGDSAKPYFEETLGTLQASEPFPIVEKDSDLVRLAFLWSKPDALMSVRIGDDQRTVHGADSDPRGLPAGDVIRDSKGRDLLIAPDEKQQTAAQEFDRIKKEIHRMDIVLVMDVTSSMKPYMDMVRDRMLRIVDDLHAIQTDFSLETYVGIVAYRDYPDEKPLFLTAALNLTRERAPVREFLESLKPFSSGRDIPEAVVEGLAAGIERMDWGEHSYRVLCLVGDAPPHEMGDLDTRVDPKASAFDIARFIDKPFAANVETIHAMMDKKGLKLYALGVGADPKMQTAFRQLVGEGRGGRFMSLANAEEFITELGAEFRAQGQEHAKTGKTAEDALVKARTKPDFTASDLSEEQKTSLAVYNVSPQDLEQLAQSRIQTGWFDINTVKDRVSVCVYLRRRDLEQMVMSLKDEMQQGSFSERELQVLKKILGPHIGGEDALRNVRNIQDLHNLVKDLPIPPDVIRTLFRRMDDSEISASLRQKMDNIIILLYQKELFNNYEEGWIPMDYLPGSLSAAAR
jgi:hypothetical protein